MSAKRKRGRGTPPQRGGSQIPDQVTAPNNDPRNDYPVLSFRFLQKGWGFDELSAEQCQAFVCKWQQRSAHTWREISQLPRHGLGSELMPKGKIHPAVPEQFSAEDKFRVYRHHRNLPMAGVKVENIYYVIWIEKQYGELYDHG